MSLRQPETQLSAPLTATGRDTRAVAAVGCGCVCVLVEGRAEAVCAGVRLRGGCMDCGTVAEAL